MNYNSLIKLKKAKLAEKVIGLQNDIAQLNSKLDAQKAQKQAEIRLPKNHWNDKFAKEMVKRKADPKAIFDWLKSKNYDVKIDGKLRHLHGKYIQNKMKSLKLAN